MRQERGVIYAGFWIRLWATLIDTALLMAVIVPLLIVFYGQEYFTPANTSIIAGPADFVITWVLPAIAVIVFWRARQATPGKMVIRARIVDAATGGMPGTAQLVIRYFAYLLSTLPLGLGFLWIAFDRRKQAWHDKLARTVVVRPAPKGREPITFPSPN